MEGYRAEELAATTPVATHPTMRDVAALAGASLKTVSRVINSDPTVGTELAARVRSAARKLDYRPNRIASDLARRRTSAATGKPSTIGLLIQDVSNEFSASIFRAVEDVAEAHGVTVLASNVNDDPGRERALTANLVARRVDGLIIVPVSQDHGYLAREQRSGVPVVFVDRPPLFLRADSVLSDNEAGACRGVSHLVEHGHQRIAFLGEVSRFVPAGLRYNGYTEALRQAGLPCDENLVRRNLWTEQDASDAVSEIMVVPDPPTALFAAHNRLTVGAIRGLRLLGLERSVALVGFDDFGRADLLQPAITVVAQDPGALGRLAAEILFRRIVGEDFPIAEHIVPTRLIVRGSGEVRPAGVTQGSHGTSSRGRRTAASNG